MTEHKGPLYKAYEMEEFLDKIFYHPFGFEIARFAKKLHLSPNHISYFSMAVAVLGGVLLAQDKFRYFGFFALVFTSVLDSADGQLARMTHKFSLKGRILDGLIGYVMFTAGYLGLFFLYISYFGKSQAPAIFLLMAVTAVFTACESSLYDFYRTSFSEAVSKRRVFAIKGEENLPAFFRFIYSFYHIYQKTLAGAHLKLLAKMREVSGSSDLSAEMAEKYKAHSLKTIRLWNLLGDNTRLTAILLAIIIRQPHWYFVFIILLGLYCAAMIAVQAKLDKDFITALEKK